MRKVFSSIFMLLGIGDIVFGIYAGSKAYFMIQVKDNLVYDGWGRRIYETPRIMQVFARIDDWPGLKWMILDTVIGFAILGLAFVLFTVHGHLRADD